MANERDIQIFRDLISRGVDENRAKDLINKAKTSTKPETLTQRALRQSEEFSQQKVETQDLTTTLPEKTEEGIREEVKTTESLGRAGAGLGVLLGTQPEEKEPVLGEGRGLGEIIKDAAGNIISGVGATATGVFNASTQTFEGLARAKEKQAFEFANTIREKLGKPPLTEEEGKKLQGPAGGLDTTFEEDLLDIGEGSLTLGFTSYFPGFTTIINTVAENPGGEAILGQLSKGIGKGGEFINKIPGLAEFRNKLPEERKQDFDQFIGQVATLGITKLLGEGFGKLKETRIRPVEEVGANILKPTAKTSLDLNAGNKGLQQLGPIKPKSFKEVVSDLTNKQKTDFPALKKGLTEAQKNIKPIKDVSVGQALDGLDTILKNQPGKKFTDIRTRVNELKLKHEKTGLDLLELQEVKTLHTQQNSLFNELGKETGGFSKEGLRAVRNDIKVLLEEKALEGGFKNVKEINTKYGELETAKQFIKLQEGSLQSYLGRQGKQSLLQDVVNFALDLPGVKQGFTAPLQTAFGKLSRSLREGKVNPIEIQKQLPALFKELKQAGMKEGDLVNIRRNIDTRLGAIDIVQTNEGDLNIFDIINF